MDLTFKNISPFLRTDLSKRSRLVSYIGLGIGICLLFSSMQMYFNLTELLQEKTPAKTGFDFLSVTKLITNENMGSDNTFTPAEVRELESQPFIEAAAPLISNQFRVKASAGDVLPFSTDLFLESVDEKFIDTVPPAFTWTEGQPDVPIIFSSDFMEMYNVFAPAQDLPQLSEKTMTSVNIMLECHGPTGVKTFRARIVALSDRINSVLVPKNFLTWANQHFGGASNINASRVYIQTKDANSPELLNFLENKGLRVNKDKTKFGRMKGVLHAVLSGIGGFGLLVVIMSLVLFSFYLQLMIAKSKENLQLLLLLGYSPSWLSKTMAKRWIPIYAIIIFSSVGMVSLLQFFFHQSGMNVREVLSPWVHWSIPVLSVGLLILAVLTNFRLLQRLLYRL